MAAAFQVDTTQQTSKVRVAAGKHGGPHHAHDAQLRGVGAKTVCNSIVWREGCVHACVLSRPLRMGRTQGLHPPNLAQPSQESLRPNGDNLCVASSTAATDTESECEATAGRAIIKHVHG